MERNIDMTRMSRIVVIGCSGAGALAAQTIKKLRPDLDVTIIRQEHEKGLLTRCATPYICSGDVLVNPSYKDDSIFEKHGISLVNVEAGAIDTGNKTVETVDGSRYPYDKLVLATGGEPVIPPIPGVDLEGVFTLRTSGDALRIIHWLNTRRVARGLIIGGGAIGVEIAYLIGKEGVHVTLVEMLDHILQNALDPDMSEKVERHFEEQQIGLRLGDRVESIRGKSEVTGAVLGSGEELDVQIVIVSAGVRPRSRLAEEAGLEMGKLGLKVNSYLQTSDPDIYSAGDLIEYPSHVTGEPILGQLRPNAVIGGRIVGNNIVGNKMKYPPLINGFATRFFEKSIAGTGITEEAARAAGIEVVCSARSATNMHSVMKGKKPFTVKLVFNKKDKKIIGAQIVSDSKEPIKSIDAMTVAIRSGWTAMDLATLRCAGQPELSPDPGQEPIALAASEAAALLT
jgi:NADH oxidase (H2O2-forming)